MTSDSPTPLPEVSFASEPGGLPPVGLDHSACVAQVLPASTTQALSALHEVSTASIEARFVSLASDLESRLAPALARVEELERVVQSLGGTYFGHLGHDFGAVFHAWWDKLSGRPPVAGSAPKVGS
jgi:hypothetical protein